MGFWKYSPFLALGILVLYQAGVLQAAPFRAISSRHLDSASLTEKELCLLLAAMVRDYAQKKIHELEQETGRFSITTQKRACNTATCVTNNLVDMLSKYGSLLKQGFLPIKLGPNSFGRRRRDDEKRATGICEHFVDQADSDEAKILQVELPKDLHLQELHHLDNESLKYLKTSGMATGYR
ncbi:calcitonin receptor-stimulating peptide 3-like [Rousettus aegyptiacus]|uniref:calcitonin receptor-stimulating peptide 3-like n=1 Tax=Rousettus aegyptiacus TaxID=9407 RepID=UPI000786CBF1|nr:calcitonin receptor-stimulating peptide 3-like [Rousettus aegyptiacus]